MSDWDRDMSAAATDLAQRVVNECACGHKGAATVKHYEVVRCGKCGKFWWALQPKARDVAGFAYLVAFPWPGPNLTAVELKMKEAA